MFDNPQKELKRLEEELLKDELPEDEFEKFYQEIYEEFGTAEEEQNPETAVVRAAAPRKSTYADTPRAVAPGKKDKSIRNLAIAVCLECVGIAALVLWWVLRIL